MGVQKIDRALCSGDFHTLMEITKISDFKTLLSNEIDTSYEQCTEAADYVLLLMLVWKTSCLLNMLS